MDAAGYSPVDGREVLGEVEPFVAAHDRSVDCGDVPPDSANNIPSALDAHWQVDRCGIDARDEAEVGDGALAADEPLLLGEHALEDAEDAQDLLLVPLDGARDFLRVLAEEPEGLAEVRSDEGSVQGLAGVQRARTDP